MDLRSHRGRKLVLAPLCFSVLAAAAFAGPQDPQSKTRPPSPTNPPTNPADPAAKRSLEERRAIAKDAARFESKYRNAVARINRLIEVYEGKGDKEHVLQLERLRERLAVRREHALEGFRKELGEAGFQRVQTQLQGGARRSLEERAKKSKPPGQ